MRTGPRGGIGGSRHHRRLGIRPHQRKRQSRLARAFRAIDFNDPPLGQSADTQRDIQTQRSGRRRLDIHRGFPGSKLHYRALAEEIYIREEGRLVRIPFEEILYFEKRKLCDV